VNANAVGIDLALAELLDSFDAFCARARARLVAGHTRYGQAWRTRDNGAELLDELADALNYVFFMAEQAKRGPRGESEPPS